VNWYLLIPIGILLIALVVFLVWRNVKDEREFETRLKNDYRKSKEEEGDAEIDEVMK
jgi:FtsZ-interacting cell division protein ZipA